MGYFDRVPMPPATPTPAPAGNVANSGGVAMAAQMGKTSQLTLGAVVAVIGTAAKVLWHVIADIGKQIFSGNVTGVPNMKSLWNDLKPAPSAPPPPPSYDPAIANRLATLERWRGRHDPTDSTL